MGGGWEWEWEETGNKGDSPVSIEKRGRRRAKRPKSTSDIDLPRGRTDGRTGGRTGGLALPLHRFTSAQFRQHNSNRRISANILWGIERNISPFPARSPMICLRHAHVPSAAAHISAHFAHG